MNTLPSLYLSVSERDLDFEVWTADRRDACLRVEVHQSSVAR